MNISVPEQRTPDRAFLFGPFKLLPHRQLLLRGARAVKLGSKALEILHLLVLNAGEQVGREALLEFVWPGQFVHDSNLKVHVSSLRRALGETRIQPTYIATVAGRGYRFIAPVTIEPAVLIDMPRESVQIAQPLPAPRPLIGRENEIASVVRALGTNRVVTLVGPGGVGKTSVAIAAAHQMQRTFTDGVCFVDLATTNNHAVVHDLLATALGLRGDPANTMDAIVDYLAQRRVLIVLDNCEHVLPAAAIIAARLQEARIEICLLATSREPLGLGAEHVQLIEPLGLPHEEVRTTQEALRYPAVELFVTRALEWTDYQFVDSDASVIANLCAALDGLPLAIELAAATIGSSGAVALLESLDSRLSPLRSEQGDVHPRHRTLWATLDWSYRLLSADEAAIFRLVSVFAGSFYLDDVIAITGMAKCDPYRTTVGLGNLVAKSLITAEVDDNSVRYRLLDCARSYALERLSDDALEHEAHHRHARLMLTLFERSEREWDWRDAGEWTANYQTRLADLRKALDWCFGPGLEFCLGARLTAAAIPLWNELSAVSEARIQVERALTCSPWTSGDGTQRAKLAVSRAWSMTFARQLVPEAEQAWRSALELAKRSNDIDHQLRALWGLSVYLIYTGNHQQAIGELGRFRELAVRHADLPALRSGDRLCAMAEAYTGNLRGARDKLEVLRRQQSLSSPRSRVTRFQVELTAATLCSLAFVAWLTGDHEGAAATAADAVEHAGRMGHLVSQSNALALAALPIALWNGDLPALEKYAARLRADLDIENIAIWAPVHRFFEAVRRHVRGDMAAFVAMRAAIDEILAGRFFARTPMYLGVFAEALIERGAIDDAYRALNRAFIQQARSNEAWCLPELLRIKARMLEVRGDRMQADTTLRDALKRSVAMGARSFELRVASDLAALWIKQGRTADAAGLLGPLYASFRHSRGVKDLCRASRLLEQTKAGDTMR